MLQDQFLNVIDLDEAQRRFRDALDLRPMPAEAVALELAHGRVAAADVISPVDVPGFDRSNVDGFAVRAADTFGAAEEKPVTLRLNAEIAATGVRPNISLAPGTATPIATGGMLPRGADAVVMVEYTDVVGAVGENVRLSRPTVPGGAVTFAGTDIAVGEVVIRCGQRLTARETGVLAAVGVVMVPVVRRPRVAILSTGDEIVPPGAQCPPGFVFDSNATTIADSVRECGGEPIRMGIVGDDEPALRDALRRALEAADMVLLSGGTSKGPGDVGYRVVRELPPPGILVHGVALKPGKPVCLAAAGRKPVVVLPGFPTSAIFTFHEFVAPVIRAWAGLAEPAEATVAAVMPMRVNSERGRTEYVLVGLVERTEGKFGIADPGATGGLPASVGFAAYPMGKGSGSVTAFGRADGFVVIDRNREYLEAGEVVAVRLLGAGLKPADLVVIGSNCLGLDLLIDEVFARGFTTKTIAVGSTAGLSAAARGECDIAPIHLLDPATDQYNRPFLTPELELLTGYTRMQALVFRRGDRRFEDRSVAAAIAAAVADPACVLVNRNRGSGTRVLYDRLLAGVAKPEALAGFAVEAKSHSAVAAAVAQGRADWGIAIETSARQAGLGFTPIREERFDFAVPRARRDRPAVRAFAEALADAGVRAGLRERGFGA